MDSQYFVYILASKRNGTLYIGSTSNLIQRILQHKHKTIKGFTKKYNVTNLVYFEVAETPSVMVSRERQLKKWKRDWKIQLIEQTNPNWEDLYEDIL
jgi:putative endonuclease